MLKTFVSRKHAPSLSKQIHGTRSINIEIEYVHMWALARQWEFHERGGKPIVWIRSRDDAITSSTFYPVSRNGILCALGLAPKRTLVKCDCVQLIMCGWTITFYKYYVFIFRTGLFIKRAEDLVVLYSTGVQQLRWPEIFSSYRSFPIMMPEMISGGLGHAFEARL